jgi:hypothetical protein
LDALVPFEVQVTHQPSDGRFLFRHRVPPDGRAIVVLRLAGLMLSVVTKRAGRSVSADRRCLTHSCAVAPVARRGRLVAVGPLSGSLFNPILTLDQTVAHSFEISCSN